MSGGSDSGKPRGQLSSYDATSNARHHPPAHNCPTDKFPMTSSLIRVGWMPMLGRSQALPKKPALRLA